MTILTKPFGDAKKPEKTVLPLVGDPGVGAVPSAPSDVPHDDESAASSIILIRRARRISSATTYILFLIALLVTSLGIIAGVFYYRQYAHARSHMRFHGFCQIPYDSSSVNDNNVMFMNSMLRDDSDDGLFNAALNRLGRFDKWPMEPSSEGQGEGDGDLANQFFKEEFELGLSEDENYSKIDVPVFRGHAGHHAGADRPERCFAQDHQGVRGHEDLPVGETRLGGLQAISRAPRARQVCRVWRQSHLNH